MKQTRMIVLLMSLFIVGYCEDVVYELEKYGGRQTDYTIQSRQMVRSVVECAFLCKIDFGIAFTYTAMDNTCRTLYYYGNSTLDLNTSLYLASEKSACRTKGWITYLTICYWFSDFKSTWEDAQSYCLSMNSTLAYPLQRSENSFLKTQLRLKVRDSAWLGGSDRDKEGTWKWSATRQYIEYSDWASNQPNNKAASQHCLQIFQQFDYKWDDYFCSFKELFICQMPSV